jgi:diacylglycerol kinase family enzyme
MIGNEYERKPLPASTRPGDSAVLVILNPLAAAAQARFGRRSAQLSAGVSCRIVLTTGPGAATEQARDAAAAGEPVVVAAGGDGTAHEVANGLLQAADAGAGDTALGVIPIGTGNDFVKVIPGTSSRPAAYDTLARGRRYRYDAGRVSWAGGSEYFLNAMGTGIDVEVVRQILTRSRRTGRFVYIAGLLQALRRYRPVHLRLETGGETLELRVMTIAIANGTCIGLFTSVRGVAVTAGWTSVVAGWGPPHGHGPPPYQRPSRRPPRGCVPARATGKDPGAGPLAALLPAGWGVARAGRRA